MNNNKVAGTICLVVAGVGLVGLGYGVGYNDAEKIVRSVANIPLRAQADLPNFDKRPWKGDLFKSKTDIWSIGREEVAELASSEMGLGDEGGNSGEDSIVWL